MSNQSAPQTRRLPLRRLLTDLQGLVLLHRELGVDAYPASPGLLRLLQPSCQGRQGRDSAKTGELGAAKSPAPPARPRSSKSAEAEREVPDLTVLAAQLQDCRQCPHHQWRQKVIFGQGSAEARLLLIAGYPGAAEEGAGLPCQGAAGELLDRMLAAIQLSRRQIYLTTLVKCIPEAARQAATSPAPPEPAAISACLPFLQQQIAAIRPALICTLGPLPAQALLRTGKHLLQLRGRFHQYRDIPLMPTLAPDFLLHNPEMKKYAWQDLQLIQKFLQKN